MSSSMWPSIGARSSWSVYGEQVFRSPVVEFCALCAMTEHGNWVLVVLFTPFLSAVTNCMPLPAAQEPGNDCALDSYPRRV
jgi:hypothetical protein